MKIKLTVESYALILYCSDLIASKYPVLTNDEWLIVEEQMRRLDTGSISRLFGAKYEMLTDMLDIEPYIAEKIVNRNRLLGSLFHAVSFLEKEGIQITTKYETNYPPQLTLLENRAPFVLYYVGNINLCKQPNLSVLGPQTNKRSLSAIIRAAITKAYDEKRILIASGVEGSDQYAMKYMLGMGGKVILFVSDHMYEKKRRYQKLISDGRLLLMSAVDPYAYFDVTNALERNINICALSNLQLVTEAKVNTGQVWFTCIYNLRYHWTKELVVLQEESEGNKQLVDMGAVGITKDELLSIASFDEIIEDHPATSAPMIDQMSIFEFIEA